MTATGTGGGILRLALVFSAIAASASSSGLSAQGAEGGGARIAVIDVQRLVLESKTGKEVLDRLKNLREQKTAEGEVLKQEITDLQERLEQGRLSLAEEKIADLEKQLEDKMIALRRFSDDADRQLQKEQEEAFARIENEVMPIISALGDEQGFTMIFNKFNSGLLFAVDEVDITDLVLQRFETSATADE